MQLQLQTWVEVEAYLRSNRGIILPIGSTEQHGPTGLIGTDAICAEVIARGVGEAAGALVPPTIAVGMAQHHLGFAGSMTPRGIPPFSCGTITPARQRPRPSFLG